MKKLEQTSLVIIMGVCGAIKIIYIQISNLGGASGLSILFYRSSTISLYLFTKVAEVFNVINNFPWEILNAF